MSAKRRGRPAGAAPPISPCEPVGLLSAPTPPEPVRCRCGAILYARASADRHEWVWVTETGELYRDDRPEGYHAHRPEPEWSPIDADDAADIIDAGLAAAHAGEPGAVPWCHGWPMRQAPDGWECRPTKRLFPYRAEEGD